jgi:MHS family proline/betaine transporter-like MFS transporter
LRILQGLAVGGESAIANVFMVENAPPGRRALASAINGAGYAVGIQLASLTALACASLLSPAELQDWGWRIPFWLSLIVATAGFWLRRTLKDLPQPAGEHSSPLAEVLKNHLPLVLRIASLTAFAAVGFQGAFIYIAEWLQTVAGASPPDTFKVTSVSMLLVTPVSLLFGWWADYIGRRGLLLASAVLGVLGSVPFFMLMQAGSIYWGQAGFVLALSIQFGVQGAMMVEVTPSNIRCTALAIGNNIGWSILGGLTPLAATWLAARTGDALAPAWLVTAAAAITAVTLALTTDPFRSKIR